MSAPRPASGVDVINRWLDGGTSPGPRTALADLVDDLFVRPRLEAEVKKRKEADAKEAKEGAEREATARAAAETSAAELKRLEGEMRQLEHKAYQEKITDVATERAKRKGRAMTPEDRSWAARRIEKFDAMKKEMGDE